MIVFDINKGKYVTIDKTEFKNEAKYYEYIVRCKFNDSIVKSQSGHDIRTKISYSFGDREYR